MLRALASKPLVCTVLMSLTWSWRNEQKRSRLEYLAAVGTNPRSKQSNERHESQTKGFRSSEPLEQDRNDLQQGTRSVDRSPEIGALDL